MLSQIGYFLILLQCFPLSFSFFLCQIFPFTTFHSVFKVGFLLFLFLAFVFNYCPSLLSFSSHLYADSISGWSNQGSDTCLLSILNQSVPTPFFWKTICLRIKSLYLETNESINQSLCWTDPRTKVWRIVPPGSDFLFSVSTTQSSPGKININKVETSRHTNHIYTRTNSTRTQG